MDESGSGGCPPPVIVIVAVSNCPKPRFSNKHETAIFSVHPLDAVAGQVITVDEKTGCWVFDSVNWSFCVLTNVR